MNILSRTRTSDLPKNALESIQKGTLGYRYKGIPCFKNPFDIALYTKLIWEQKPRTIIEIGSAHGGSALWLADLLRNFYIDGHVYSVDVNQVSSVSDNLVTFVEGNVLKLNEVLSRRKLSSLPRPFLVIEDSAHYYETTYAALDFFDPMLAVGEYILIEDGIVNDLNSEQYGRYKDGPNRAIFDFLESTGNRYMIDESYCDYFGHNFTYNTNGYLKRIR